MMRVLFALLLWYLGNVILANLWHCLQGAVGMWRVDHAVKYIYIFCLKPCPLFLATPHLLAAGKLGDIVSPTAVHTQLSCVTERMQPVRNIEKLCDDCCGRCDVTLLLYSHISHNSHQLYRTHKFPPKSESAKMITLHRYMYRTGQICGQSCSP